MTKEYPNPNDQRRLGHAHASFLVSLVFGPWSLVFGHRSFRGVRNVLIAGLALLALTAPAQNFDLSWFTIDGGGGTSTNEFFELSGTIGQPDAGVMGDGFYQIEGGFWAASVASPPFITLQPRSVTASFNETVTFRVEVSGSQPLRYQWRLNGVILQGETNPFLTIRAVQLKDAGAYTVIVANEFGAVLSDRAILSIRDIPTKQGNDNFAERVPIFVNDMLFTGNNFNATFVKQCEPRHAGKIGGASVWFSWRVPAGVASGIATFRTLGSTFDTLLAVYVGDNLCTLQEIASNDDRDRGFDSEVRFFARAGVEYQIAIDGLGGRMGNYVLSWEFEATSEMLPLITMQPKSRSVRIGGSTKFEVVASGNDLTYQWLFNGKLIPGENGPMLIVSPVSSRDVGTYSVTVTLGRRSVTSLPAALEIGSHSDVVSYEKIADLRAAAGYDAAGVPGGGGFRAASGGLGGGFVSVSVGTIDSQIFDNNGSKAGLDDCPPCGIAGGAIKWFGLKADGDGVFTIDTMGSAFDTVLSVFLNTNESALCMHMVRCDNNSAPDGIRSMVSFPAVNGMEYLVGVDGVSGATGEIHLNWTLCLPAAPFEFDGTQVVLTTETNAVPGPRPLGFHWRKNGLVMQWTTEPLLPLASIPVGADTYSVIVSNSFKRVTNVIGNILSLGYGMPSPGTFQIILSGVTTQQFQVELAAPALTDCNGGWLWLPVTNYSVVTQATSRLLNFPVDAESRFYRVRPKPPGTSLP